LLLNRVPVIGFQVDETSEREQVKWRSIRKQQLEHSTGPKLRWSQPQKCKTEIGQGIKLGGPTVFTNVNGNEVSDKFL
jgi:hypothetical protein